MADSTFLDMRNRIADELQREDLESQIEEAITDACVFYQQDSFFANDTQNTMSTVAGQNDYTAPTDVIMLRQVTVIVGYTLYTLQAKSWEYINREDSNTLQPVQGPPVHYAVNNLPAGMQIRLFPTPDAVYSLGFDYIGLTSPPVNDTDSNFWTLQARQMIRNYAKYLIRTSVIGDYVAAAQDRELADLYFRKFKQRTGMSRLTGHVRAYW